MTNERSLLSSPIDVVSCSITEKSSADDEDEDVPKSSDVVDDRDAKVEPKDLGFSRRDGVDVNDETVDGTDETVDGTGEPTHTVCTVESPGENDNDGNDLKKRPLSLLIV